MSRKIKISVKVLTNKVNKAFQNRNRECWGKWTTLEDPHKISSIQPYKEVTVKIERNSEETENKYISAIKI